MYHWNLGREEKENGAKKVLRDIMAKNLPNLERGTQPQIQEAEWISHSINLKKSTPRYIMIKLLKTKGKEKILKESERNYTFLRGRGKGEEQLE